MSTCWTICNDCKETFNHQYLTECLSCGSRNIDRDKEYEPPVRDLDDQLEFDEDLLACAE
jgi:hypothetical protein